MIDIEKEILALTEEAQDLPDTMNIDRIRKKTKKRKRIHTIGVIGKSMAGVLVTMFLALFIAVNSSVSVARAFSDAPVIGPLSQRLVVRSEIKKAMRHNKNLAGVFEEDALIPVEMEDSGTTGQMKCTVDSFYADELALVLCLKLDTKLETSSDSYFYMTEIRVIDLNTGEDLYENTFCSMDYFDMVGKFQFTELYWKRPCTDFKVQFNVSDPQADSYDMVPIDSFSFEFHDVEPAPAIHIPLDETITACGLTYHFTEIQAAGSMTKVFYEWPYGENMKFYTSDLYITDQDGNIISDEFQAYGSRMTGYDYMDETTGKKMQCDILPSISYEDPDSITIHISQVFCSSYDPRFLKIDPENKTGTFEGRTFPIEIYDNSATYSDFGAPSMPYYDSLDEKIFVVVPYEDDMPEFNGTICLLAGEGPNCDGNTFPTTMIDGKEYLVIEYYKYTYDLDGCYYFVQEDDSEFLRANESFDVDI
ncbi:MAG: hypothetical protein IK106_03890 [Clostridiales bacterium]|nr:hypothetical protein [Clostridiales bacterium]